MTMIPLLLTCSCIAQGIDLGPSQFGVSVVQTRDWDQDGTTDLVIGDPIDSTTAANCGSMTVCSGATGRVLLTRTGEAEQRFLGGVIVSIGDVDADGCSDLLVGQGLLPLKSTRRVWVLSEKDLTVIREHSNTSLESRLGMAMCGTPDLDGDSIPDYVIADPGKTRGGNLGGIVTAYSAVSGRELWSIRGAETGDGLGSSLACVEAASKDAGPVILAFADMGWSSLEAPRNYLLSLDGRTGKRLASHTVADSEPGLGELLAVTAGSTHGGSAVISFAEGMTNTGHVSMTTALDPTTLAVTSTRPLRSPPQTVPPARGNGGGRKYIQSLAACCMIGDWNGDGVPDCAVADNECAAVYIVSGQDCSLLATHDIGVSRAGVTLAYLAGSKPGEDRLAIGVGSREGAIEEAQVIVVGVPSWNVLLRIKKS
jgi:hypothetical protein